MSVSTQAFSIARSPWSRAKVRMCTDKSIDSGIQGSISSETPRDIFEEIAIDPGQVIPEIISGHQLRDQCLGQEGVPITRRPREALRGSSPLRASGRSLTSNGHLLDGELGETILF
jgi:hypothetical protein